MFGKDVRVVVTGLGAITPIGLGFTTFKNALFQGKSGAGSITKFDAHLFKTQIACELKDFDPQTVADKKDLRKLDGVSIYALAACEEALQHSCILKANSNQKYHDDIGVIWATGNGGFDTFEQQVKEFYLGDGTPKFNPFFMPKALIDAASGMISLRWGLRGVNFTSVSACASGNSALMEAFLHIKAGTARAIVVGGSEAAITPAVIGGFNALKALSTRNETPAQASRPLDTQRDGFVMGEGGAALILESLESALERGAEIFAELVGVGQSGDAYHMTSGHPEGEGAVLAMRQALRIAGIEAKELDHINLHATSTPVGDRAEMHALKNLLQEDLATVSLSATKSMTGHLLGAAGALEALVCIASIQEQKIPPTLNLETLDPEITFPLSIAPTAINRKVQYVMSNNFGFGGHNAIAIFKSYEPVS